VEQFYAARLLNFFALYVNVYSHYYIQRQYE